MDARKLELFLAVLDSPTMTVAAERMHLSTAAVSVQIHALSDELNADLFVRAGRRLVPTAAARRLEAQARRVVNEIRSIREAFENNDASRDARPFHFATGATALIYRLTDPLRAVRAKFPKLDLRVSVLATEEMVDGVLSGRFDLVLISLPFSHPHLRIVPLFEEELLVLRPNPNAKSGSRISTIRASLLDGVPMVLYPPTSNMRLIIDDFFEELKVTPRVVVEASDTEVIKCMVEAGFGYSVLPEYALIDSRGFFQTLRVAGHRLIRNQALATSHTAHARPLTAEIMAFLKHVLDQPQKLPTDKRITDSRRSPENRRPLREPVRSRS